MKICRVESLVYGVGDLEAGVRYYRDWGLRLKSQSASAVEFDMPSGQTVVLKHAADAMLPQSPFAGPTVREVIWGVDTRASLDALQRELKRDREVKVDADGTLHAYDDLGFGIGFGIMNGVAPAKPAGRKMNKPFDPPRSAAPQRIGHVVYSIKRADQQKAADFYMKRLQFRMTDHTGDMGDFLRCNGANDHHNLFFLKAPDFAAFNHVAFEVRDFDEIIFGDKNMKHKSWKPHAPPGRHILGSNLFWYFVNPSGGHTEYFCDMDLIDDDFQTRNWEKSPGYSMWILDPSDAVVEGGHPGLTPQQAG